MNHEQQSAISAVAEAPELFCDLTLICYEKNDDHQALTYCIQAFNRIKSMIGAARETDQLTSKFATHLSNSIMLTFLRIENDK